MGLTGFYLKLLAILAMLIDHIAYAFVQREGLALIMHGIGRITAPIMCYFIAEGYYHTSSFWRYFIRLILFAVLSQLPFSYFNLGGFGLFPLNVMYTLALGLLAIYCYEKITNGVLQSLAILGIMILSFQGDWIFLAIIYCLVFHIYRSDFKRLVIAFSGVSLITLIVVSSSDFSTLPNNLYFLGMLFVLPLLYHYNGKRGGGKYSKWLFYLFYPLHLLVLGLLRWWQ